MTFERSVDRKRIDSSWGSAAFAGHIRWPSLVVLMVSSLPHWPSFWQRGTCVSSRTQYTRTLCTKVSYCGLKIPRTGGNFSVLLAGEINNAYLTDAISLAGSRKSNPHITGLNLQPILLVAPPNEDSISQFSRYHWKRPRAPMNVWISTEYRVNAAVVVLANCSRYQPVVLAPALGTVRFMYSLRSVARGNNVLASIRTARWLTQLSLSWKSALGQFELKIYAIRINLCVSECVCECACKMTIDWMIMVDLILFNLNLCIARAYLKRLRTFNLRKYRSL